MARKTPSKSLPSQANQKAQDNAFGKQGARKRKTGKGKRAR